MLTGSKQTVRITYLPGQITFVESDKFIKKKKRESLLRSWNASLILTCGFREVCAPVHGYYVGKIYIPDIPVRTPKWPTPLEFGMSRPVNWYRY